MDFPIPITVVTGFLGSGKTTLLASLMKDRKTRRLAILINEFGEVSIDGAIVRQNVDSREEVQIYDFAHGLIAYGDDKLFIPTLRAIADRRASFDHVLIETSGLALPTAVMETLRTSGLASDFILDATLAVVDTPLLLSGQFEHSDSLSGLQSTAENAIATLFARQLEYADVVVLNKINQLDENALLLAETRVRKLAPNIRFLELAYHGRLDVRLALGLHLHQPTFDAVSHRYSPIVSVPDSDARPQSNQRRWDGHAHSGLDAHAHGVMTHRHFHEQDPGWLSFVLRSHDPQDMKTLESAIVTAAESEPILRTKGIIRTADPAHTVLVQGVRTRVTSAFDAVSSSQAESELVFIGYHLKRANVATLLTELTGTRWT
ncbi:MAG: CobW family GTP-binding protein [Acidiferrobacterales bacterium]